MGCDQTPRKSHTKWGLCDPTDVRYDVNFNLIDWYYRRLPFRGGRGGNPQHTDHTHTSHSQEIVCYDLLMVMLCTRSHSKEPRDTEFCLTTENSQKLTTLKLFIPIRLELLSLLAIVPYFMGSINSSSFGVVLLLVSSQFGPHPPSPVFLWSFLRRVLCGMHALHYTWTI